MTQVFDKNKFAQLLNKARGENRSMRAYSLASDVSAAHLSRLARGLIDSPPTVDTLKKLAVKAQGGVTLAIFMDACGYLEEPDEISEEKRGEVAKVLFRTQKEWSVRSGKHSDYELIREDGTMWEWIEGGILEEVYGRLALYEPANKRSIVVRTKYDLDNFLENPPKALLGEYTLILLTKNEWKEVPFKKARKILK